MVCVCAIGFTDIGAQSILTKYRQTDDFEVCVARVRGLSFSSEMKKARSQNYSRKIGGHKSNEEILG